MTDKYSLSLILDAICSMDSILLKNSISDYGIYFELHKEKFVDKMEIMFELLKSQGNTHFHRYKGNCEGKICNNYECSGYIFVSNYTREYFNFILETSDLEAIECTRCHAFSTDHYLPNLGAEIELKIYDDEKYNFTPDEKYLQTKDTIKSATEQLGKLSVPYLSKDNMIFWVEKYSYIFDDIDFIMDLYNYSSYKSFGDLFYTIEDTKKLFDLESDIALALSKLESYSSDQYDDWYASCQYLLRQFADFNLYFKNSEGSYSIKYKQYIFDPGDFKYIITYSETAKYLFSLK